MADFAQARQNMVDCQLQALPGNPGLLDQDFVLVAYNVIATD